MPACTRTLGVSYGVPRYDTPRGSYGDACPPVLVGTNRHPTLEQMCLHCWNRCVSKAVRRRCTPACTRWHRQACLGLEGVLSC